MANLNHETVETRPLGLLVREKTRAYVTPFPYDVGTAGSGESLPEARDAVFSPTGDCFVSIEGATQDAVLRDAVTGNILRSCGGLEDPDTPLKIHFTAFSPRGTYLLAWSRPVVGVSVPNLVIYRVATAERMAAFHQKVFHVGYWPSIQWSDDESIASRNVTNNVHFFKGDELHLPPYAKLNIPGVTKFALSKGAAPYTIAAFIGGTKGAPARIATYKHPDEGGEQLASRSTFRADTVTFKWNSKGTALLALISSHDDSTGKSYYGDSEVYFMDNVGVVDQRIELPQEGPTYDVEWSPGGTEFVIIYGFMPARATMFNEKCEPTFDFGTGSRNTISFSPHGRYVALAGFGNLPGAIEFWDKNKTTLVGRGEIPCTTMYSWSPCSRYFLGATTFPRLRVDNGLQIVRVDGKKIHEHKLGDGHLLQAVFRPALRGTYADPKHTVDEIIGGPLEAPKAGSAASSSAKKGGVYRPPSSRGVSTMKVHQHIEAGKVDKAGFLSSGRGQNAAAPRTAGGKKIVPGMDPELFNSGPSKAAIARKKKKEREQKFKTQQNGSASTTVAPPPPAAPEEIATLEDAETRAKKLRRKKRAIDALRVNHSEGKELNPEQLQKLETGPAIEEELAKVEHRITELKS